MMAVDTKLHGEADSAPAGSWSELLLEAASRN